MNDTLLRMLRSNPASTSPDSGIIKNTTVSHCSSEYQTIFNPSLTASSAT
jgi:hypothetical protein